MIIVVTVLGRQGLLFVEERVPAKGVSVAVDDMVRDSGMLGAA